MNENVLLAVLQGCLTLASAVKELINSDPSIDWKVKERARLAISDAQHDLAHAEESEQARLDALKQPT